MICLDSRTVILLIVIGLCLLGLSSCRREAQTIERAYPLGGYGTWSMAAMFPNKFATIVPMSGRILPRSAEMKKVSSEIVELANAPDPYRAFAKRIGQTPVWIFHGSDDNLVPVENSRKIAEALTLEGNVNARYSEVERAGHEPLGFQSPQLYEWLVEKRKLE